MVMSKSFDRNAAKKAGAKRALPKGGGKGASGYKLYTPVKQSTINNIKSMGMSAALKKAGSSKNAEFVQGVKRMYGVKRLEASMAKAKKSAPAKSPDAARAKYAAKNKPAAKSADEARSKYAKRPGDKPGGATSRRPITIGTGPNKVTQVPKYTSKNPKPMSNKGLFPGLLGGKK
jgi:hypothetical protein